MFPTRRPEGLSAAHNEPLSAQKHPASHSSKQKRSSKLKKLRAWKKRTRLPVPWPSAESFHTDDAPSKALCQASPADSSPPHQPSVGPSALVQRAFPTAVRELPTESAQPGPTKCIPVTLEQAPGSLGARGAATFLELEGFLTAPFTLEFVQRDSCAASESRLLPAFVTSDAGPHPAVQQASPPPPRAPKHVDKARKQASKDAAQPDVEKGKVPGKLKKIHVKIKKWKRSRPKRQPQAENNVPNHCAKGSDSKEHDSFAQRKPHLRQHTSLKKMPSN